MEEAINENRIPCILKYLDTLAAYDARIIGIKAKLRTESDAIVSIKVKGVTKQIMASIIEAKLYSNNKRHNLGIKAIRYTDKCPIIMMLSSIETVQVYIDVYD